MLRVVKLGDYSLQPYTIIGWIVNDIAATIDFLERKGVRFERYEALEQDSRGICTFPNGDKGAWFKDPDGNTLSINEPVN